jgi:hypothetical protein
MGKSNEKIRNKNKEKKRNKLNRRMKIIKAQKLTRICCWRQTAKT